ncbi:MAG: sugar phosphate nucleotidyltransferase [bacterium]|nr:sugar phosphate nucleotidyltransferase [bacterium]
MSLYPIIMAGGAGTRLWPISTKGKPKQVYPLLDDETLLQKTWKRLRRGFPAKHIFVSTGEGLALEAKSQLKGFVNENIVLEPARKGTAPALALALLKIWKRDPEATFVYINADNYIANEKEFIRLLRVAQRVVTKKSDHVVLIGVNPTYPEPGLGYIKMGAQAMRLGEDEVFDVEAFVEKPDMQTAKAFLKSWQYLWNPTLIVARADHFLGLYKKYLPQIWRRLERISEAIGTSDEVKVVKREFPKIEAETIDYGILEKEKKMLVLPGNFGWTDVGNWKTVHEVLAENIKTKEPKNIRTKGNICRAGKCVSVDSSGNLIYSLSGKLVALAGVKNMILIESENALLLCPKNRTQDVKKLVENLEKKGMKEYL